MEGWIAAIAVYLWLMGSVAAYALGNPRRYSFFDYVELGVCFLWPIVWPIVVSAAIFLATRDRVRWLIRRGKRG